MYQRLLVPVDASPCAEVASRLAVRLARAFGSHVLFMHALTGDDPHTRAAGVALLERLSKGARLCPKLILETLTQNIAQAIVGVAEREGADMIVIGAHAQAKLERDVLGSVAHDVAVLAQVPVLMVPAQIREQGLEGRWRQSTATAAYVAAPTARAGRTEAMEQGVGD